MQLTFRRAAGWPRRLITLVAFAMASHLLPSASAMEAGAVFKQADASIVVVFADRLHVLVRADDDPRDQDQRHDQIGLRSRHDY